MNNSKIVIFLCYQQHFAGDIHSRFNDSVLARFEVADPLIGGFQLTSILAFLLGTAAFFGLNRHPKVVGFSHEVVATLKGVHWPAKEETVRSTVSVIGITLFIAFALGTYDYVYGLSASVVMDLVEAYAIL